MNILGTRKIFWRLGKYFYLLRTLRYWKPPSWPPSSEPAWEWSEGVAAVTWRLAAGGAGAGAVPGRDTRLGHSLLSWLVMLPFLPVNKENVHYQRYIENIIKRKGTIKG